MKIMNTKRHLSLLILLAALNLSAGCTSIRELANNPNIEEYDPLEPVNRDVYAFNDKLDELFIRPVAATYDEITPDPVRTGITNFFNNLGYINVIVNSSLQGKLDQSLSDLFRFLFNSTLGVAGLFDVATPMGLQAHKEDLGQTLAVWELPQGAYLVVPLFGSTTVRDAPDYASSYLLSPLTYAVSAIALPAMTLNLINRRANLLQTSNLRDSAALDPYSFTREAYLQQRRNLIYDGAPPLESYDDVFYDLEDLPPESP